MDFHSELNRIEKERQIVHAVKITEELLEHLSSTLGWFMNYCEKNQIYPPNYEQMRVAVKRAEEFLEQLPPHQPKGNTDNIPTRKQNPIKGSVQSEGHSVILLNFYSCKGRDMDYLVFLKREPKEVVLKPDTKKIAPIPNGSR